MADLFSVKSPLLIRCRDGRQIVMVERFVHPHGLLFFALHWERGEPADGIHLIHGEIRGQGPWKIGECVVTLLGCQGTHPELAGEYANWLWEREAGVGRYPSREQVLALAREFGAEA